MAGRKRLMSVSRLDDDPQRVMELENRIATLPAAQQRVFRVVKYATKGMSVPEVAVAARVPENRLWQWMENPYFYSIWTDMWFGVLRFYAGAVAKTLTLKALDGNIEAIRLFFELLGWQQQDTLNVVHSTADGNPIPISIVKADIEEL